MAAMHTNQQPTAVTVSARPALNEVVELFPTPHVEVADAEISRNAISSVCCRTGRSSCSMLSKILGMIGHLVRKHLRGQTSYRDLCRSKWPRAYSIGKPVVVFKIKATFRHPLASSPMISYDNRQLTSFPSGEPIYAAVEARIHEIRNHS